MLHIPRRELAVRTKRFLTSHYPLMNLTRSYDVMHTDPVGLSSGAIGSLATDHTGLSYVFDGVGNSATQGRVLVGGSIIPDITTQSFSCSCEIWYSASFGSNFPGVINKRAAGAGNGWAIYVRTDGPAGRPYSEIAGPGGNTNATFGSAMSDSKWHLVVLTLNRTSQLLSTYVDNLPPVTANSSAIGSLTNGGSLTLGCRDDGAPFNNKFVGRLRNVRFWKGHALTRGEINALYQDMLINRNRYRPNSTGIVVAPTPATARQSAVTIITT